MPLRSARFVVFWRRATTPAAAAIAIFILNIDKVKEDFISLKGDLGNLKVLREKVAGK